MKHLPLLVLALAGCGGAAPALGDHPLDGTVLAESPLLAHLAAGLTDGAGVTAGDLLDDDKLVFGEAPDPSDLFMAQTDAHTALPALSAEATSLRVLTWNTGLLDRTYLFGSRVAVPSVAERLEVLPERVLADGWDILLLQEVWEWEHVLRFAEAAEAAGYRWYAGTEDLHHEHGLIILVRADLVGGDEEQVEVQFDDQRKIENWPGPDIKRGYLEWAFTAQPSGIPVRLFDTHPQAFVEHWQIRSLQARQVGLAVDAAPDDELVLLGADLNAGPYYPADTFGQVDGEPVTGWWKNTITWPLLQHYGGLTDLPGALDVAQDVAAMGQVPDWSEAWFETPLAGACDDVPPGVFTATDCNSIYFDNYAGQEYPARLDHLFWRDDAQRLRVLSAEHVYVTPEEVPGAGTIELSDHYGVGVTIAIEG